MAKPLRIGEILVQQRVLNEQQVFEITQAQKQLHLPFGVLAEQMFDVTLDSIETAWVEQYHRFTGTIDLTGVEPEGRALTLISRRQAWQFEILPVRLEATGELLIAAGRERLARAVPFVAAKLSHAAYFRIADRQPLHQALRQHYPMPEIFPHMREKARRMDTPAPTSPPD